MYWISGFNGGRQQNFSVSYSEDISDKLAVFEDKGQGKNITAKIYPLFPGRSYSFKVIARNIHGYSKSEEIVCNTTAATFSNERTDTSTVLGAAVGVCCATVVILTLGVIIFLVRRRNEKEREKEKCKRAKNKDKDDDDGLIDNILYQSVGSNIASQSATSADVYAIVEKKEHHLKVAGEKTQQETSLSKRKQTNEKKKGDVSVTKELKWKDKQQKHEDVYENTENIVGNDKLNPRQENINKDGLQYAELVFNPLPNGAKLIIHGLDDRIIYAVVDTAQKIDPLPENDDEEANSRSLTEN